MENERKITVMGVIQEGIGVGLKNSLSLLGAIVLWILTIWIPYINVGTTIAIYTIPVALSKGKVISPTLSLMLNIVNTWENSSQSSA